MGPRYVLSILQTVKKCGQIIRTIFHIVYIVAAPCKNVNRKGIFFFPVVKKSLGVVRIPFEKCKKIIKLMHIDTLV